MTQAKFSRLKAGDTVTLAKPLKAYGSCYPVPGGRVHIPAGSMGIVGSVRVPPVRHRDPDTKTYFHCIDFPPETLKIQNPHRTPYRVAAYAEDLE